MAKASETPVSVETFRLEFMYDDVNEHTFSGVESINLNQNWKEVMRGILEENPGDYIIYIQRTPFPNSDDEHGGEPEIEPMIEGEPVAPKVEPLMKVETFKGGEINSECSVKEAFGLPIFYLQALHKRNVS